MIIYDFDTLPDRRASESNKWHTYDEDVLPMWVADMDFVSPEPVIRALHERVAHGVFGYPQGNAERSEAMVGLRQEIVSYLLRKYQWQVASEALVFIPGVVTGLNLAVQALTQPGDAILIQPPVYHPFLELEKNARLARQDNPLICRSDGSYEPDFDAFMQAFTPETRLFAFCNPHNPIGRVYRRDELMRLAELCLRKKVLICSDEIHCDLVYSGYQHIPIASLDPEIADNSITLIAPSKTYNLAGLSCSVAIIPNQNLRKQFLNARRGLVPFVNLFGLVAAEAAYREGQEWLDQLMHYLEDNRDYLHRFVMENLPGVSMTLPEATYLAWLDCRQAGLSEDPAAFFLRQARVAVNGGPTFGAGGEGFVRLNFGCPRGVLEDALQRMKSALAAAGG